MKSLEQRLETVREHVKDQQITVMILGLGSVGNYLLDYLLSMGDPAIRIVVVGKNQEKMERDVNIARISAMIRRQGCSCVIIESKVDFTSREQLTQCIRRHQPDFLVNASRVYSGLKYGSVSWKQVRAYGIWAPLAIPYIRTIMEAYADADAHGIIINTSYSDAVIPWLKSAGKPYPDLGSGNLNHLIPRIRLAVAREFEIPDPLDIDVTLATSHFHDVVISKEGHTEGIPQLLSVSYQGKRLEIQQDELFRACCIPMPTDAKRNQMNASSNFDLIMSMVEAIRRQEKRKIFSPGALGELGGYPLLIDGREGKLGITFDETTFSLEEMRQKNKESIALDGIEAVEDGVLIYTDALLEKVKQAFHVYLPKRVPFDAIDETASFLIREVIQKNI